MAQRKLISADSHIIETPDWYYERIDKKFRDQAPRMVRDDKGQLMVMGFPGMSPFKARGYIPNALGQSPTGSDTGAYEETPKGAFDPSARLVDMAKDGVEAEVLYPTIGLRTFTLEDTALRAACFRAHNDQLSDYVAQAPRKLLAIAMLETSDIQAAVKELERNVKRGHRGAMISSSPPAEQPYSSPYYDPLWAAASEMNIPLSLHVLTGTGPRKLMRNVLDAQPLYFRLQYVIELQEALTQMIEGAVFERFPKLKIITVEGGVGWMLGFATNSDFAWLRHQSPLKRPPSEYIKENIFATFQQDSGVRGNVLGGYSNFMWASDYPHGDSIWPLSQEVVAKDFAGLPEQDTQDITWGNAARAYNIAA
jgi:predicted TIM-barrel fold metal-dependent hydrolase